MISTAISRKGVNSVSSLTRESFDRDLNKVLIKASIILGKHLRTHSFRATFITDLLSVGVAIHDVEALTGHRDIQSTYSYNRSSVTQEQARAIMNQVNQIRKKHFKMEEGFRTNWTSAWGRIESFLEKIFCML